MYGTGLISKLENPPKKFFFNHIEFSQFQGFFEESMKCNVLSRKSTQQVAPEDFSRAFVDSLQRIKTALEGDQFTELSS